MSIDSNVIALVHAACEDVSFSPDATRFVFLRHGSTIWNEAQICQGQSCNGLSDTGLRQAVAAAALLADHPITRVAASDLQRVRQTVKPLEPRGLPTAFDERLREKGFGGYETKPYVDRMWWREDQGVERVPDFVRRTADGMQAHLDADDTMIAAHGGLLFVLTGLLGIAMQGWARGNAIPMLFERTEDRWQALAITDSGLWPIDGDKPKPAALKAS